MPRRIRSQDLSIPAQSAAPARARKPILELTIDCATCVEPLKLTGQARANALRRGRAYCPNGECGKVGQAVRSAATQTGRPVDGDTRARISAAIMGPLKVRLVGDTTLSKLAYPKTSGRPKHLPLAKLAKRQKLVRARSRELSPAERALMEEFMRRFSDPRNWPPTRSRTPAPSVDLVIVVIPPDPHGRVR